MKKYLFDPLYYLIFGLWWIYSILPMPIHYFFATLGYLILRFVMRYRRKTVSKNLRESFPHLSKRQLKLVEMRFYLYFVDLIAESVKFFSISKTELKYRMQFKGLDRLHESLAKGRSCACFLGHNGNWEYVSSLPLWVDPKLGKCLQLYHPLENPIMDRLVGYERERMGSTNIPMAQSIRHIMKYHKEGTPVVVGFIGDQVPVWESLNYWLPFFNHDTPVMTGGERIARKMDMDCYYIHMRRKRRGRYEATFQLMTETPKQVPEHWITEEYFRRLEENIKEQPSYWLWTHKRWKRNREGYIRYLFRKERWNELFTAKFIDHEHPEGKPVAEWARENGFDIPAPEKLTSTPQK